MWNILKVLFVCWLVNVCVFNTCVLHSDGLVELQGIEFLFSLVRFFLKTFPCLTLWPPIISWRFLLHLNAIISVPLNTQWNSVFICKIFQFLFTILVMLGNILLYVNNSRILFLLFFSLHVNSSFLSILSAFLICTSRTSSLYCQSRNFCLMIAQFLSNTVLVEQIVFSLDYIECFSLEILGVLI